jgi:hypothetical protein
MILDSARQKAVLLEVLTEPVVAEKAFALIKQGHALGDEVVDLLRAVRDAEVPAPRADTAP